MQWHKTRTFNLGNALILLALDDGLRIPGEGHQREVQRVVVVLQVKDSWESRPGEFGFSPRAVGLLSSE